MRTEDTIWKIVIQYTLRSTEDTIWKMSTADTIWKIVVQHALMSTADTIWKIVVQLISGLMSNDQPCNEFKFGLFCNLAIGNWEQGISTCVELIVDLPIVCLAN